MDEEEYKRIVVALGKAFKSLPDDRARIDVLASLLGIMKEKIGDKQGNRLADWLDTAHACLECIVRFWR